jgi:hypothetical protein
MVNDVVDTEAFLLKDLDDVREGVTLKSSVFVLELPDMNVSEGTSGEPVVWELSVRGDIFGEFWSIILVEDDDVNSFRTEELN